jgi:hypothetical protein
VNNTPTRRYGQGFPPELRWLDNLEVSLRGLSVSLERAQPVLEGLRRDQPEAVNALLTELEACDLATAINALVRLKASIERATQ